MSHACPAGCGRRIGDELLLCVYHWSRVPRPFRHEVWRTWKARLRALDLLRSGHAASAARYRDAAAAHEAAKAEAIDAMRRALEVAPRD